jgi:nucleoside-diphosphate-sugar epimerase
LATYLVTGGAGFIGSNIVCELVARGETVRVFDNFSTGRRNNLTEVLTRIELIEGDLRDADACRRVVQGVDYILHQAAIPSVKRSVDDPLTSHHANTTSTLNLLLAARDNNVKRLVFASSSSIYGDSPTLTKVETMPPAPKSPYAIAKLAAEAYCRAFTTLYGFETVCLRYFNVFGPGQDQSSDYAAVIPKFIVSMCRGQPPIIYGDGLQSRDFTYVANVVEANLLAVTAPNVAGEVFNIACGSQHTLLDLITNLNRIFGTNLPPINQPLRMGDIRHSQADIQKARDRLGFEVLVGFEGGLAQTVDWYRRHFVQD